MSYRVVDLKEELEKRGLSKSGAKKDLVERLEGYILENEAEDKSDPPSPNEMEEDAAPSIQIDTNLEENDIVKEYMMMRQNQFKSALEESGKKAESPKIAGEANEDDEDAPLSRNKSPRKRGRGRNSSAASDSDESVKSPAKRMKSPLNEALSPPPPPLPFDETKSLSKRLKSPTSHVSDEPELPQQESPSKRSRRTSNKVQSYEEPPDDDEPLIMPEIRKKPEVVKKVEKPVFSPPPQPKIKEPAAVVVAEPEESKVAAIDKKVSKQPEKEEVEPVTKVEEDKLPSPPPPTAATTTQVLETKAEKEAETKVDEEKAKEVSRKVIEPEPTKEPEPEEAEEAVDEILVSETVTFDDTKEEDSIVNENLEAAPEEKKEQPVTAFRKLSRLGSNNESSTTRKKRTWGDSKKSAKPIEDIAVSSSELKDIIPDLKPVLEEIKHEEEKQQKTTTETEKNDDVPKAESSDRTTTKDAELPKNPTVEDPAEKVEKASDKSKNQRKVVEIRNLVRPFTSNQLVQLLKRTGKFDENRDFWIDKIKSHALVKYETADEAEETVMALDGVKWPSSNQKKLIVTFSSDDHFLRQSQSSVSLSKQPPRLSATAASASSSSDHPIETTSIKRSASENYEEARERKRGRQDSEQQQSLQAKEQPKKEQKSLEVLFQKTKALPSIYWMPKS